MGSKRFKNLDCAYCNKRKSVAGDHIFAREFFLPVDRDNLPQAPTCEPCNNAKSKLEHYLTTVLPFGGYHPQASMNLTEMVPKRLSRNQSLRRELQENQRTINLVDDGAKSGAMALPIKEGVIEALFFYIVRGLVWHHWVIYISPSTDIEVLILTTYGAQFFQDHLFSLWASNRVFENLGNGTVIYEGIQGVDSSQISVWRFHMYGGIIFTEANAHYFASEVGVISSSVLDDT